MVPRRPGPEGPGGAGRPHPRARVTVGGRPTLGSSTVPPGEGRDGARGRKDRLKRRNSTGSYPGSTSSAGGGRGAPRRWHWRTSAGDDSASESGVSPIGGGGPRLPPRTRHPQQQPQPHQHKDQTETTGPKAYNRNWGNVLPHLN